MTDRPVPAGSDGGRAAQQPPPEGSSSRGLWIVIWVLLAPAAILPLVVGIYDRTDPELAGFPFYFWFQFALIPVAAVLTLAAFVLAKKADQRDREARRSTSQGGGR
jgi:hypothetical protein